MGSVGTVGGGNTAISRMSNEELRQAANISLASGNAQQTYDLAQEAQKRGISLTQNLEINRRNK